MKHSTWSIHNDNNNNNNNNNNNDMPISKISSEIIISTKIRRDKNGNSISVIQGKDLFQMECIWILAFDSVKLNDSQGF